MKKWLYGAAGFTFAATVINPNMTRRRSFYLKKFNCALLTVSFMSWPHMLQNEHVLQVMLKNYDYFPYEVKRTLATKDHRYMVNFNYKESQLFDNFKRDDPKTWSDSGKSLS